MSRETLPATGKSYKIKWTLDGNPIAVADKVERFTVKVTKTRIKSMYIGESGSQLDEEFEGWEGSFTAVVDGREFDDIEDAMVVAAKTGRRPNLGLNIEATYSDGTVREYAYPGVVMEAEVSGARGETVKAAYTWATGSDRLPIT